MANIGDFLDFMNPFIEVATNTSISPHAHALRTSFLEKLRDAFFVLCGNFGWPSTVTELFYTEEDPPIHVGILDILTLNVTFIIHSLALIIWHSSDPFVRFSPLFLIFLLTHTLLLIAKVIIAAFLIFNPCSLVIIGIVHLVSQYIAGGAELKQKLVNINWYWHEALLLESDKTDKTRKLIRGKMYFKQRGDKLEYYGMTPNGNVVKGMLDFNITEGGKLTQATLDSQMSHILQVLQEISKNHPPKHRYSLASDLELISYNKRVIGFSVCLHDTHYPSLFLLRPLLKDTPVKPEHTIVLKPEETEVVLKLNFFDITRHLETLSSCSYSQRYQAKEALNLYLRRPSDYEIIKSTLMLAQAVRTKTGSFAFWNLPKELRHKIISYTGESGDYNEEEAKLAIDGCKWHF